MLHPDRLRPLYAEFFCKAQVQSRPGVTNHLPEVGIGFRPVSLRPMGHNRAFAAPSPHPSPRRGEGDDVSLAPSFQERPGRFPPSPTGSRSLSFVVGVSDEEILSKNFMASPCVSAAGSPHQVILASRRAQRRRQAESRAGSWPKTSGSSACTRTCGCRPAGT